MNVYTKEFDNAVHDIFIWIFQEHIMGYHYYNTIILIIKLKTTFISNFDSKQKHLQISWFDNVPVYHVLHAEGTHILSIIFLAITNSTIPCLFLRAHELSFNFLITNTMVSHTVTSFFPPKRHLATIYFLASHKIYPVILYLCTMWIW